MLESLHLWELPYIHAFQKAMDSPFLDFFFRTINLLDDKRVVAGVVVLIWIWGGWRWGAVSAFLLSLSGIVNYLLKNLFAEPRPVFFDPTIGPVLTDSPFGLPSGTAQTAVILAGLLIFAARGRAWAWIVGIAFGLSLSLSRVYIGVHFFSDLIGGWIVGAAIFSLLFLILKIPGFKRLKTNRLPMLK